MKKYKKFLLRTIILILILIPFFYLEDFYYHFYNHFTGNIITIIITNQWHIVILSILLFTAFLIPLSFKRKKKWFEYGLASAFFVSLFVEMYGIPLTILFASKYFFNTQTNFLENIFEFKFLGVNIGMDLAMVYSAVLMILLVFHKAILFLKHHIIFLHPFVV